MALGQVVFAGLFCGLWLDPEEMMGDRLAAILVAMLIVVTSLQSDLGLGRLSYLIWVGASFRRPPAQDWEWGWG